MGHPKGQTQADIKLVDGFRKAAEFFGVEAIRKIAGTSDGVTRKYLDPKRTWVHIQNDNRARMEKVVDLYEKTIDLPLMGQEAEPYETEAPPIVQGLKDLVKSKAEEDETMVELWALRVREVEAVERIDGSLQQILAALKGVG